MDVFFLGTGGGRTNLLRQVRATGGFLISGSLKIWVDPGPGAIVRAAQYKQKIDDLDAIIVTHAHIDHVSDAGAVIEAMTAFATQKIGTLVVSKNCLSEHAIDDYHLKLPEKVIVGKAGDRIDIPKKKRDEKKLQEVYKSWNTELGGEQFKEEATGTGEGIAILNAKRMLHDEKSGFGLVLEMDGKRIGYTSDTDWYEGIAEQYSGCDLLIVNCLRPFGKKMEDHFSSEDVARLAKEAKPKLCVMSHLGMGFIKLPAEVDAEKIAELSGVRTIAARDGMRIGLPGGEPIINVEKKAFL